MKIEEIHQIFLTTDGVSTDTRSIKKNTLFIALKGENFDANSFATEALKNGASYVIIDNKEYYIDQRTILVENSLKTLQELAKFHRFYLDTKIIGLTGSNGKTTTKELFNAVLSKKFNTIATIGNLNNHIGVPLTLLRLTKKTEIGIIEMGANHQKEIEFLCSIAQPDLGYITNFGKAHLEGFGGVEGVIKGKSELFDYLKANQKIALINLDDSIQEEKSKTLNNFTFSNQLTHANVFFEAIEADPFAKVTFNDTIIQSNLIGIYNATNICAAIAIGTYFNISTSEIKEAIETYTPDNNRSQIIEKNSNKIVLDAYNANPSSMQAALTNFFQLEENNKTAILGDMFELGSESFEEHQKIINFCKEQQNIHFFFVGEEFFKHKINSEHFYFFKGFEDLSQYLQKLSFSNQLLLIKGSRGMKLERVLDFI
ncbi:UDP-N-acetylmuramoyl-tripeptide--D-alanyl-D-alanine ligase [Flavobacterium sp. NRK F10]|uniref:UDP-N-acetylmuramoyl-tripeptide--D-alanyl-D- alanine ligase n=1 Tax=Flavobacterium sp. NRK F10 TaxID=2954931 RepID=UPI002091880F|nr:UDP-N-acetylmuramoyl-tripeptide--D-alanyl-D-alanine ligase [Flavobacterium sp. NRK F10]MCO6174342.1 UDP-N-acetylmuramoyl-tripeptide--D-alanyl-D-alanine ligase [Flavobacterium sp. NRK F10]